MSESVILIGGSGHARSLIDCIQAAGDEVFGILDDGLKAGDNVLGVPVLGRIEEYTAYRDHLFLVAIGDNGIRTRIAESMDLKWYTAIHPAAEVSRYAKVGPGSVVMANAVINSCAEVGMHCIVNTGAIVEHDNRLEDFVHLSPRVALGGGVCIRRGTHVGIGAVVRDNQNICGGCVIGAGAVVVKDIDEPGTYVGIPARRLK